MLGMPWKLAVGELHHEREAIFKILQLTVFIPSNPSNNLRKKQSAAFSSSFLFQMFCVEQAGESGAHAEIWETLKANLQSRKLIFVCSYGRQGSSGKGV